MHFSSSYLHCQPIALVNIAGSEIRTSMSVHDLGVTLDQCLSMSTHVSNLCKSAPFALKCIGNVCQYLDQPAVEKRIHTFVSSKLNYCNSLLYGLLDKEISKLQHVQNSVACMVTKPGEWITSHQFFVNFIGCLYIRLLFLRFCFLLSLQNFEWSGTEVFERFDNFASTK